MTMEASLAGVESAQAHPRRAHTTSRSDTAGVEIGLSAAIVAVHGDDPQVVVVEGDPEHTTTDCLPYGAFSPVEQRTLDVGLRNWVGAQTGLSLGYAEQLYTFADRGRHAEGGDQRPHIVSIGYLALTRTAPDEELRGGVWRSWYDFFPWEDWRDGRPKALVDMIEPSGRQWAAADPQAESTGRSAGRLDRLRMAFGLDGATWDEEKVVERYELLYEAGLVEEAWRDASDTAAAMPAPLPLGATLAFDHRRILATAIGRVRAKIKYRPVIFELMDDEFTLFELQKTVEAILGPHLHKQNFRRLVESAGLVELTGDVRAKTGGRPAKLYRFREDVLLERPAPGVRVKSGRI